MAKSPRLGGPICVVSGKLMADSITMDGVSVEAITCSFCNNSLAQELTQMLWELSLILYDDQNPDNLHITHYTLNVVPPLCITTLGQSSQHINLWGMHSNTLKTMNAYCLHRKIHHRSSWMGCFFRVPLFPPRSGSGNFLWWFHPHIIWETICISPSTD